MITRRTCFAEQPIDAAKAIFGLLGNGDTIADLSAELDDPIVLDDSTHALIGLVAFDHGHILSAVGRATASDEAVVARRVRWRR